MIITYQEENYFKIQSGDQTILVDPTNQRSFKGASVILITSSDDVNLPNEREEGSAFVIRHQGEYEVGGIRIQGWSTEHEKNTEKTMYKIQWDDISLGILGPLTKELDSKTLFALEQVDILIVPAGGKPYLSQAVTAKIVRQLEPGIVIPSLFSDSKLFLKEMGSENTEIEEKLTIKKKDVPPNAMKVHVLAQNASSGK